MKTVIIIPAYNAADLVAEIINRIPPCIADEIIALDDGSQDDTFKVLSSLKNVTALQHKTNGGYGKAQITLHNAALRHKADIIVLMHADGGHLPEELPQLIEPLRGGRADVVIGDRLKGVWQNAKPLLGSRTLGAMVRGQMPVVRLAGHLFLTATQNFIFGTNYRAWHSGYRAITGKSLERIPYNSFGSGYLFDTEFLLACHHSGLRIEEVSVSSYYDPRAKTSVEPFLFGLRVLTFVIKKRWGIE